MLVDAVVWFVLLTDVPDSLALGIAGSVFTKREREEKAGKRRDIDDILGVLGQVTTDTEIDSVASAGMILTAIEIDNTIAVETEILESQGLLVQLLAIKGLAEAPARVDPTECLETCFSLLSSPRSLHSLLAYSSGGVTVAGQESGFDAFKEDLIVEAGFGGAAERD